MKQLVRNSILRLKAMNVFAGIQGWIERFDIVDRFPGYRRTKMQLIPVRS
jgi:hypothetical protein